MNFNYKDIVKKLFLLSFKTGKEVVLNGSLLWNFFTARIYKNINSVRRKGVISSVPGFISNIRLPQAGKFLVDRYVDIQAEMR